ncbi:MAG: hypothetical protein INF84_10495 [Roseomonas sp.]|nr:hypothetical protein [Roseomonas sp.]
MRKPCPTLQGRVIRHRHEVDCLLPSKLLAQGKKRIAMADDGEPCTLREQAADQRQGTVCMA